MTCASLPIAVGRVTSGYGWRNSVTTGKADLHTGLDLGAPEGTPVLAMLPGRVVVSAPSGQLSGYGNVVVLEHSSSLFSLYAHLAARRVATEQVVAQGAELGTVGRTAGTSDQPSKLFGSSSAHLHLEFLRRWPPAGRDADRIDPAIVLGGLGVIVPTRGPLALACAGGSISPSEPNAPFPAQNGSNVYPASSPSSPSNPGPVRASTGGVVPLLLLFAAFTGIFGPRNS